MIAAVGGDFVAAGLDFANEIGETFGEPAEHKKGATGPTAVGGWRLDAGAAARDLFVVNCELYTDSLELFS